MSGTLFVVATPIGNLEDAPPRLARVLASCALVLAEDTRRTRRLLTALGVASDPGPRVVRCDEHAERRRIEQAIETLRSGHDVALVTDAGTPAISDPGYRIVSAAHDAGLPVSPIPGPSSVTAALSVSGLPTDAFVYQGFLPRRRGPRRKLLESLASEPRTLVVLETPHRAAEALADAADAMGPERACFLGREMTKLHEECVRTTLGALAERFAAEAPRGELVLVIAGASQERGEGDGADLALEYRALVERGAGEREALRLLAKAHGLRTRDVYRRVRIEDESE